MARGDSTIRVNIIGDAKQLTKTLDTADTRLGSFGGAIKGAVIGGGLLVAGDQIVDFANKALDAADKFDDSISKIAGQVSPEFAGRIKDMAFDFERIGLSADEVGDLASAWSALATAAGISKPAIESLTPEILDIAVAVSAQTGKPLNEVIDDIGKAANGNKRAVQDYGIVIDKTLTPDQLAFSVLDQFKAKFGNATDAINDTQGAADILGAKIDNLGVRFGENLKGPVHDFQLGLIYMTDTILPNLSGGFDALGDHIGVWGRDALNPIALVMDALGGLGDLLDTISHKLHSQFDPRTVSESQVIRDIANRQNRNGLPNTQGRP